MKENFRRYSFLFVLFLIGSFLGFAHENLLELLKGHYHLRQGLIYEPLIPIYGIGLVAFYLIQSRIKLDKYSKMERMIIIFFLGFIMGGLTEYICSFVQEKVFGTVSWDYSKYAFNLNGRTSAFHAVFWGLMSLAFYVFILPLILKGKRKVESNLSDKKVKAAIIILSVIFLVDCTISSLAVYRQSQRRNNVKAATHIQKFLDKYYPDDLVNTIYNNAVVPKR